MSQTNKIRKYLPELKQIAAKNHGVLRGEDIVAFAANKKTTLHDWFEWDNTKAAYNYRLFQARQLVRVSVEILPRTSVDYRAFVSLVADQQQPGGGYRVTSEVLDDTDMRASFLEQALEELGRFEAKYSVIKELAEVFAAFRKVKAKTQKRRVA